MEGSKAELLAAYGARRGHSGTQDGQPGSRKLGLQEELTDSRRGGGGKPGFVGFPGTGSVNNFVALGEPVSSDFVCGPRDLARHVVACSLRPMSFLSLMSLAGGVVGKATGLVSSPAAGRPAGHSPRVVSALT